MTTAWRGTRPRTQDSYPRRPWLAALWIPVGLLALPAGGVLMAFGGLLILPGVVLLIGGATALVVTPMMLGTPAALRVLTVLLLLAPLIGVPILSYVATQDTVLTHRGVPHRATVDRVVVSTGRTTSYRCVVRYQDQPAHEHSVHCDESYQAGRPVRVTDDPDGWVEPQFTEQVEGSGAARAFALMAEGGLLVVSVALALLGVVHRTWAARRRRALPGIS
ncbi:hypothetical protein ABT095_22860 [Kitasatospora sp. NPDC002227]|uniref:hypothetical protein n=1 Tax=Kitasatospora sp. NPDC002227 TaxID=3154773 RepID=UPI00332E2893